MSTSIDVAKRGHAADHAPGAAADLSSYYVNMAAASDAGLRWVQVAAASDDPNRATNGLSNIDQYTPLAGDLILLTKRATASQNGIWVAASGTWTRPSTYPSGSNVANLAAYVANGSRYSNTGWTLSTAGAVLVDATAQTWRMLRKLRAAGASTGLARPGGTALGDLITVPGVGFIARTGVFNVLDYGATQDAFGSDHLAIQAAIDAAKAAGGGIVYLPAGTYQCAGKLTLPNSTASSGAVHLIGDGSSSTFLRFTADPGAGSWAVGYPTPTSSAYSRVEGLSIKTNGANGAFLASGLLCPSRSTQTDVFVQGFKGGFQPYNDHIRWRDCGASGNVYGLYYGQGPTANGDHNFIDCNFVSNTVASIGLTQAVSGASFGYGLRAADFTHGHLGYSPYCIYIEPVEGAVSYLFQAMANVTFKDTSWEAPSTGFIYEAVDSLGNRHSQVETLSIVGAVNMGTDNVSTTQGVTVGALRNFQADGVPDLTNTGGGGAFIKSGWIEGVRFTSAIAAPMQSYVLRASNWRFLDGYPTGCEVIGGDARYTFHSISGALTAAKFAAALGGSYASVTAPVPSGSASSLYPYTLARPMSVGLPILGLCVQIDTASAVNTTWILRKGIGSAARLSISGAIAIGTLLYMSTDGSVSTNSADGPYVGWCTVTSADGSANVMMFVDGGGHLR